MTLKQNKSATSAGLVGTYSLMITPTELRLIEINQTVPLVVWTYQEIRSFTRDRNVFNLEVGRRAQTGAGEFFFNTQHADEVYKLIEYHVERQLRDETIGQDVRNRLRTQPVPQTEPLLDISNDKTDEIHAGTSGRYHRIDLPTPQEGASITGQITADQSGNYHHLEDSLIIGDRVDSTPTMDDFWKEIDSKTDPYGKVVHFGKWHRMRGAYFILTHYIALLPD